LSRLPGSQGKILRVLLEAYPQCLENAGLARRAGYKPGGGAYNNPLGRLHSLGLIEYTERAQVVGSAVLFLEGTER
jgi:hypothetical protein